MQMPLYIGLQIFFIFIFLVEMQ